MRFLVLAVLVSTAFAQDTGVENNGALGSAPTQEKAREGQREPLPETIRVKAAADVQKVIRLISDELNTRLPMRVDSETILLTSLPYTDNSLLYRYKMVNMTADQFEDGRITEKLKPPAVATYKTAMPTLMKLGVKLVYHYTDKDGNFIESFTVGPEDL